MAIDVWMQHPTQRFLAHDMVDSLRRWTGGAIPDEPPPIDVTLAAMDDAGFEFGLLSAWHGPGGPLIANDVVAGWVEEHPDRFAALAAVDPARPMEAVRELRRCVSELGFKGPLRPSETGRPIPYIDRVAIDFPELVIACGPIGYPWTEEMVAVARKHEHVHIDRSAYTAKRYPPELVAYLRGRGGRRKVMLGSNHPMIPPRDALADLGALELDDETHDLFLGGNAERVFGL